MRYAEYRTYLESEAWKVRAEFARALAGNRCVVCNAADDLHVHHRTYERVGSEHPGDLTVLCARCHGLFHGILPAFSEIDSTAPTPASAVKFGREVLQDGDY